MQTPNAARLVADAEQLDPVLWRLGSIYEKSEHKNRRTFAEFVMLWESGALSIGKYDIRNPVERVG